MKKSKTVKQVEQKESVISLETFKTFGSYEVRNLEQPEPSCFNGMLRIKKYKVTIEPIEENTEVYAQRLKTLWENCDNSHHWDVLKGMGEAYGIQLGSDTFGCKIKRK